MAVKFISHVDQDQNGNWFIKLTDTLENSDVICKDLDEYKTQIEELGGNYGGDIEVVWTRSNTLNPANIEDLSRKMEELQKEYQDEINQINDNSSDGGFNPNG